ncbi:ShlB/FhaC/HecB family hemolysin secretion/activation protein [uncultured Tateyamaria sp.]|uniref:ShlB/FhaC/HecB family hemolysin secretion/activation protein n=1 Tax=uncultured Tateyamaria sp. TaxID=455651 RepID=UPI00261AC671|nr:ShlB/FhaC/HecB family hemolysin secretion/activation protein [uncultured Tateyamaria sp.]
MRLISCGGTFALAFALAGLAGAVQVAAQTQTPTASQITPDTLQPPLQRLNGAVVFTGQAGTQAPPGSEAIGITLSAVDLEGGLPQLAAENAALEAQLTRGRIPVSELFDATADLEAAYAREGFVLSRVILPQQRLRDGGRLRVVVVNGFIEEIDTSNVPENTRARIDRLTEPLVGKPGLTREELERQLLLAGDTPGTALKSALGPGEDEGGAKILLDPEFRPVTGFVGFGNPNDDDLGEVTFNTGIELNSPFRFGETIYLRASGAPQSFFGDDPRSRILAGGVVVPLGFTGLSFNAEFTNSRTTPDNPLVPTESEFDRQSLRLSYPFRRSRDINITGQVALDFQDDEQDFVAGDVSVPIFRDEITVLRLGGFVSYFHENDSVSEGGLTLSRGIDAFGARTAADAASSGLPLSRAGSDATFTKLVGFFSHRRGLTEDLSLSVAGRFQSSFGDALVNSEQFSMVGAGELSTFDSGTLRGDSGWVIRSELSTQTRVTLGGVPILLSPYLFAGIGQVTLEEPTAIEQRRTEGRAYGIGMDIFAQTDSSFRSSSLRIELGRGERDDGTSDETRFMVSGTFRY